MGLFSKKSKVDSAYSGSIHDEKTPNGSLKSPTAYAATANATPAANADIPEVPLPRAPDPTLNPAAYLRSIYAVRDRSKLVLSLAKRNQLKHFDVDMSKFGDTARYVCAIINVSTGLCTLINSAKHSAARLCAQLQVNTCAWQVAAF